MKLQDQLQNGIVSGDQLDLPPSIFFSRECEHLCDPLIFFCLEENGSNGRSDIWWRCGDARPLPSVPGGGGCLRCFLCENLLVQSQQFFGVAFPSRSHKPVCHRLRVAMLHVQIQIALFPSPSLEKLQRRRTRDDRPRLRLRIPECERFGL